MKKESFKGFEPEKIPSITLDEFTKMTTSRNRRTIKRLNQNPRLKNFMKKVREVLAKNPKKLIKTHIRDAIILPEWMGAAFGVYNGKEFKRVDVTWDKIGKRLGDYSHSCSRVLHSGPGVGATRGSKFVPLK